MYFSWRVCRRASSSSLASCAPLSDSSKANGLESGGETGGVRALPTLGWDEEWAPRTIMTCPQDGHRTRFPVSSSLAFNLFRQREHWTLIAMTGLHFTAELVIRCAISHAVAHQSGGDRPRLYSVVVLPQAPGMPLLAARLEAPPREKGDRVIFRCDESQIYAVPSFPLTRQGTNWKRKQSPLRRLRFRFVRLCVGEFHSS